MDGLAVDKRVSGNGHGLSVTGTTPQGAPERAPSRASASITIPPTPYDPEWNLKIGPGSSIWEGERGGVDSWI